MQRASQPLWPRPLPRRPLPLATVELEVIMSSALDWIRPLPRACSFFLAGASLAVNSWSALAASACSSLCCLQEGLNALSLQVLTSNWWVQCTHDWNVLHSRLTS